MNKMTVLLYVLYEYFQCLNIFLFSKTFNVHFALRLSTLSHTTILFKVLKYVFSSPEANVIYSRTVGDSVIKMLTRFVFYYLIAKLGSYNYCSRKHYILLYAMPCKWRYGRKLVNGLRLVHHVPNDLSLLFH